MIATCLRVALVVIRHHVQEYDESRLHFVAFLHPMPIHDVPGMRLVAFIHLVRVQARH